MPEPRNPLLRIEALRALEARALAVQPQAGLMERAGTAVARLAMTMTAERGGIVLVLAGPGNNGGDALVAARVLIEQGIDVRVGLLGAAAAYRGDAAVAWARWSEAEGSRWVVADPLPLIAGAVLIVDGLFGIGISRAPDGKAASWIAAVNLADVPVLAIDVPSGVDANTGHVPGDAIIADRTLTFIADKPGLHTGDAVDHVGLVTADTLGADVRSEATSRDVGSINEPRDFAAVFAPRRLNSHKGSNGSVAVIGGDHGMVGAALMASRMALHAGAGRVYVRLLATDAPGYDVLQPELMLRASLDGVDASAFAVGPGLGHGDDARELLGDAIDRAPRIVIDADGLNLVAKDDDLATRLAARPSQGLAPAVLTPHPLEAARLLGCGVDDVQQDRIAAALRIAERYASVALVKGAGTIIATPDGTWLVNPTGNPSLGTGGTGDILCGLVAGLLAQHTDPLVVACAAVWLHGKAADDLVADGTGPVGLAATELIPAIRAAINRPHPPR
jgi:hydroxyethylthiazole kinase-like uncharacterized protein yjeF